MIQAAAHTYRFTEVHVPLREPFRTATGEIAHRATVLVEVSADGFTGWGEAAPFPGQDETIDALWSGASSGHLTPTLAAAIDEAAADLSARQAGAPLLLPSTGSLAVSTAVGIDRAVQRVGDLVAAGVVRFKLKVAPGRTRHVQEIREAHPDVVLGIDGNRGFDPGSPEELLALGRCDLAYAEELFPSWEGPGPELFAATGIPHFADESIRSVDDAKWALRVDTVGGVTVKPGRLGWRGSLDVIEAARASGKPWRASGLLETGVGRAFTDLLAAAEDAFISDVAPATAFLGEDVAPDRGNGGRVVVPVGPGTGVDPDIEAIDRHAVRRLTMQLPLS